jgi:hypothetical protein
MGAAHDAHGAHGNDAHGPVLEAPEAKSMSMTSTGVLVLDLGLLETVRAVPEHRLYLGELVNGGGPSLAAAVAGLLLANVSKDTLSTQPPLMNRP